MKKYELDTSRKICLGNSQHLYFVYRIKALKDFADVRAGDYGGYVTEPTQPRMLPISIGGGIGEQRGENKRMLVTLN